MRIFFCESLKLLRRSYALIFIFVLIINGILLCISSEKESAYPASAYKSLCAECSERDLENAFELVNNRSRQLEIIALLTSDMKPEMLTGLYSEDEISDAYEAFRNDEYLVFTDSLFAEEQLFSDVLAELEKCRNYPEYFARIDEAAERMLTVLIFSDADSYSAKRIVKTPQIYRKLAEIEPSFGPSKGIENASDFLPTDIIAVIIIAATAIILVTRERELSQLELSKATYNGRAPMILSKLTVCIMTALITGICLYTANFAVSGMMYGFGDFSRCIQSVSNYNGCHLRINVMQFIALFLASKLAAYMIVTAVIFLITVIFRRASGVYIATVSLFGAEAVLYRYIGNSSYLSVLRNVNITAFLDSHTLFEEWRSINFFSEPISAGVVFIITAVILVPCCSAASVIIFGRQKTASRAAKIRLTLPFKGYRTSSIFLHEMYKIFIGGKALHILVAFAIGAFILHTPVTEEMQSVNDVYYKQYIIRYSGDYTDEKYGEILDEEERLSQLRDEFMQSDMSDIWSVMSYNEQLAPYEALLMTKAHMEYISQIEDGSIFYDKGFRLLTGDDGTRNIELFQALIAEIMLLICCTYAYSVEYETGSHVLLRSSYNGRAKTFAAKYGSCAIIAIIVFAIAYLPRLFGILSVYGTIGIHEKIRCMEHFSGISADISIMQYLIILYLLRFMILLVSVLIIFAVSRKSRSYIVSMLVGSVILVLPIILAILNVPGFKVLIINGILRLIM